MGIVASFHFCLTLVVTLATREFADGLLVIDQPKHLSKGNQDYQNRQQKGHQTSNNIKDTIQKDCKVNLRALQKENYGHPQNTLGQSRSSSKSSEIIIVMYLVLEFLRIHERHSSGIVGDQSNNENIQPIRGIV